MAWNRLVGRDVEPGALSHALPDWLTVCDSALIKARGNNAKNHNKLILTKKNMVNIAVKFNDYVFLSILNFFYLTLILNMINLNIRSGE